MLTKLLKYDFKSMQKTLLTLYAAMLGFSVIYRIFLQITQVSEGFRKNTFVNVVSSLGMMFYIFLTVAIFIVTFVMIISRYYKSLYTDEGYLTNTLPVSPASILTSKLISSFCYLVLAFICVLASLAVLLTTPDTIKQAKDMFEMFFGFSEINFKEYITPIVLMVFAILVQLVLSLSMFFFCISLGQVVMPKNKIMGSILSYIVLYVVSEVFMLLVMLSTGFTQNGYNAVERFFYMDTPKLLNIVFAVIIGIGVIGSAIFFTLITLINKKKLNLD